MSEPTPEQPEEPKRRDLTRAFSAVVRPPGEKKSLSSYLVTVGMTVVLAGAVALGVGAIVFRPHAKDKPVAAANRQRSRSSGPSASPRIMYRQPQPSGANPPAGPAGRRIRKTKNDRTTARTSNSGSGGGSAHDQAKMTAAATTHFVVGNSSRRCLDISGGRAVSGTPVQIWDCRSGLSQQQWAFVNGTLRSMGMCLTATGSSAGAALVVESCNGSSAQLFRLTSAYDIVHSGTNKCVDVKDKKTAAGTRLQIWTCNGQQNQKWRLS